MIKFASKLLCSFLLLLSSSSFAGFITTDLAEDTYVTYGGYDWTWVSSVNSTNFEGTNPADGQFVTNVLEDPTAHAGWMFIQGTELETLFSQLTLSQFQVNGEIIQSAAYWNSHFVHVDVFDFNNKSGVKVADGSIFDFYDTFYVRASLSPVSPVTSVPEPTTLFIFGIGLVGFGLRQRTKK